LFQHQDIWLPDGEKHFVDWMNSSGEIVDGKGTYQIKKFRAAMEYVKNFRVAVDVGAHVGLWSMQLAQRFDNVIAFEPVAAFRECFVKNAWMRGVKCFPYALGAERDDVWMVYDPSDSGGTHVALGEKAAERRNEHPIEMRTLDEFELKNVDLIKIDCEGYERQVIEGARETVDRCKPCIIVEQKQHIMSKNFGIKGTPAVDLLREMGGLVRRELSGDFIVTF
jgi:FkbM family methyltransferase